MKKVLVITYYWPPSGGAGVQRWLKFTKYLPEYGWEPIVLTVDPQKASYAQIDESLSKEVSKDLKVYYTKTCEVYSIYKRLSRKKEIPFGGFSNQDSSNPDLFQKISMFLRGNFFLPDPRRGWNRYALREACRIIKENSISTVVTTSPPHSTQLIGLSLKKKLNIKWIADLRDPWCDIYYYHKLRQTKVAAWLDRRMELKVLRSADRVIAMSNSVQQLFSKKLSSSRGVDVVHNGYDSDDFTGIKSSSSSNFFTITYTGTITNEYDISGFISAVTGISKVLPGRVKVHFVGNVPGDMKRMISDKLCEKGVKFTGYVTHRKSISLLLKSDVLLLIIPKCKNNAGITTGKIFEYLAAKKPVLCIGPIHGDAASIIRECNSGKTFDYSDSHGMRKYLMSHIEQDNHPCSYSPDKYSRKSLTSSLAKLLDM